MQQLLRDLYSLPTGTLISVCIIPVLFAITVHEVSHGWIAKQLGDPTAQRLGRLTLNPLKHIDPIGTMIVPGVLLFLTGGRFVFGWAKPVPVTWENLRHPKRDMVLVALAGPISNLFMAILWAFIAKMSLALDDGLTATVATYYMGISGIFVNILLMVFNLLPLPPLDGGRVAAGLLPGRLGWGLSRIEPYGFFILIALMITDILGKVVSPIFYAVSNVVVSLMGLT